MCLLFLFDDVFFIKKTQSATHVFAFKYKDFLLRHLFAGLTLLAPTYIAFTVFQNRELHYFELIISNTMCVNGVINY